MGVGYDVVRETVTMDKTGVIVAHRLYSVRLPCEPGQLTSTYLGK